MVETRCSSIGSPCIALLKFLQGFEQLLFRAQAEALAHRGFLARARHIPVEALYAHAQSQGKRLVLCGASHFAWQSQVAA